MQAPPEMKLFERKHLGMRLFHQNENDWLLLIGSFSWDYLRNEILFLFAYSEK